MVAVCSSLAASIEFETLMVPCNSRIARPEGVCKSGGNGLLRFVWVSEVLFGYRVTVGILWVVKKVKALVNIEGRIVVDCI